MSNVFGHMSHVPGEVIPNLTDIPGILRRLDRIEKVLFYAINLGDGPDPTSNPIGLTIFRKELIELMSEVSERNLTQTETKKD